MLELLGVALCPLVYFGFAVWLLVRWTSRLSRTVHDELVDEIRGAVYEARHADEREELFA